MLSASLIMFALRLVDLMEPATHPRSVQLWMVLPLEPALRPLESAVSSALHVEAQAVRTTPTPSFQHFPPTVQNRQEQLGCLQVEDRFWSSHLHKRQPPRQMTVSVLVIVSMTPIPVA